MEELTDMTFAPALDIFKEKRTEITVLKDNSDLASLRNEKQINATFIYFSFLSLSFRGIKGS